MSERVRPIGINHVALEVEGLEEAVAFYQQILDVRQVEREPGMAFLDLGDQFIALTEGRRARGNELGHFGLVVEDKDALRARLRDVGVRILPGPRLDFCDCSGNRVQAVDYRDIKFTKTDSVLRGMGIVKVSKHPEAVRELRDAGLT